MTSPSELEDCPGTFRIVPIDLLRTPYAGLRPGRPKAEREPLAPLPLRVVPADDGTYTVLDGHKRLAAWREQGYPSVLVALEAPGTPEDDKRRILLANAPARTLTAMDEAEVVRSIREEDGASERAIARGLSKTLGWVSTRLTLATALSSAAKDALARTKIGPTVAHALCAVAAKAQPDLLDALDKHELTSSESFRLISAFCVADDRERRQLLREPRGVITPPPLRQRPSEVVELERRLLHIESALRDFARFVIPEELAPPDRRRLEAICRSVTALIHQLAAVHDPSEPQPEETTDVRRPRAPRTGLREAPETSPRRSPDKSPRGPPATDV